jgi:phosphonate transport system substrate-binding protein
MVDAGAISSIDWQDPRRVPEAFRADFRIIHESAPYPRALELVRAGIEPAVEARLREVLLQAAEDPAARDALKLFFHTSRFMVLDPASEQALDALRKGAQRVRSEVE